MHERRISKLTKVGKLITKKDQVILRFNEEVHTSASVKVYSPKWEKFKTKEEAKKFAKIHNIEIEEDQFLQNLSTI